MIYKINSTLFYLSFFSFLINLIAYLMGLIQIISAINFALIIFGFIGLTLGLMLTKKSPLRLKMAIVGLIGVGSLIWILAIFKIIDFAVYWKIALLLIFGGIIWAIWNKIFPKGNLLLKICFGLSSLALLLCTLLTCFSFFDDSNYLFYILLCFTASAILIMLLDFYKNRKKSSDASQ